MDSKVAVVGAEQLLSVREQWEKEVLPKLEGDIKAYQLVRSVFQAVSEGRLEHVEVDFEALRQPKRDLAEERRARFGQWYQGFGFTEVTVPKPDASNREFKRRAEAGQALFYRPATGEVSYEAFMAAVGQGQYWTVVDAVERAKIAWEPADAGYWFWAEVAEVCPRLKMPWNNLNAAIHLLALEEYAVVWHALKAQGVVLDASTWCWLRTRYKVAKGRLSALSAGEAHGRVPVGRGGPENLARAYNNNGGRAAEVVYIPVYILKSALVGYFSLRVKA